MSAATQTPGMTVAEFLAWRPPASDRWELIDGITVAMAPSSPRHGSIAAQAARLIGNHRPASRVPRRHRAGRTATGARGHQRTHSRSRRDLLPDCSRRPSAPRAGPADRNPFAVERR